LLVEALRYPLFPGQYTGRWWAVIVFCVLINLSYHIWNLPDTFPKVIVSAAWTQMPMPYLIYTLLRLGERLWTALVEFVRANMVGPSPTL